MTDLLVLTALNREARAAARRLGDGAVVIQVIGIGGKHLPAESAQTVVLAGYGGALSPDLHVGDVVIDDPQQRAANLPFRYGRIHCSSKILATPVEKRQAFERTGALAVDMESESVRRWADQTGAAYIGIRAITDAADQPLNPKFLSVIDDQGRPKMAAILRRPGILPALIRLAGATRQADAALANAVAAVVAAMVR